MKKKDSIDKTRRYENQIKPKRFYDELAEMGILEDFLKLHAPNSIKEDKKFKEEIFEILMKHSPEVSELVERIYLEKLCESLGYFLEYTREWRNPKL